MLRGVVFCFVVGVLGFSVPLSGKAPASQSKITGTVSFRQRVALPLDAVIDLRLEQAAVPGSPAKLVSEAVISAAAREQPISFELPFDSADINPANIYQLRATVTSNGTLLFISTSYPVLTRGAPTSVAVVLQPVNVTPSGPVTPRLQETYWKLTLLAGKQVVSGAKEPHLVLGENQKFTGATGCNDISGSYRLSQNALTLIPPTTLPMMCSPEMTKQEQALFNALKATRRYRIQGETLELTIGDEVLATFQARRKK